MQGVVYIGGACPDLSHITDSLEERRIVIAADSGYDNALRHNIPVDILIGDFDSIANIEGVPDSVRRIQFPRDKDQTDTELAIAHAKKISCERILLVGGGGGRSDHLFALLWLFEGELTVDRWISDRAIVDYIDSNWQKTECAPGEVISLLPVGAGPWQMASSGLRWPLDGVRWHRHNIGISNEAISPTVSITLTSGALLVVQNIARIGDAIA